MDKGLISFPWNVSGLLTIGISIRILSLKLKGTTLSLSIALRHAYTYVCAHTHTNTNVHAHTFPHTRANADRLIASSKQEDNKQTTLSVSTEDLDKTQISLHTHRRKNTHT